MNHEAKAADRLLELRPETREFLSKLEPSDLTALQSAIMFSRRVADFGFVMKWLAIAAVAIAAGIVTFGESILKIGSWFRH